MSILFFKLKNIDIELEIDIPDLQSVKTSVYKGSVLLRSSVSIGYNILSVGVSANNIYNHTIYDDSGADTIHALRLILKNLGFIELHVMVPITANILREATRKRLKEIITLDPTYYIPKKIALLFPYTDLLYICSRGDNQISYCSDDNFWKEYYYSIYDQKNTVVKKPKNTWKESVEALAIAESRKLGDLFVEAAIQGNLSIISDTTRFSIMNRQGIYLQRILYISVIYKRKNVATFLLDRGIRIGNPMQRKDAVDKATEFSWTDLLDKLKQPE